MCHAAPGLLLPFPPPFSQRAASWTETLHFVSECVGFVRSSAGPTLPTRTSSQISSKSEAKEGSFGLRGIGVWGCLCCPCLRESFGYFCPHVDVSRALQNDGQLGCRRVCTAVKESRCIRCRSGNVSVSPFQRKSDGSQQRQSTGRTALSNDTAKHV